MSDQDRTPNPIDIHVGQRIRGRRKMLNISQERLADDLHLTFQQVQKYERGANRVSASKLWQIAGVLDVAVSYFFEGLARGAAAAGEAGERVDLMDQLAATDGGFELARNFVDMEAGRRQSLLRVAATLANETPAAAKPMGQVEPMMGLG